MSILSKTQENYFFRTRKYRLQKKNTNLIDIAMGADHEAEDCKIVGVFLNNLANKFDKNSVGLYRDLLITLILLIFLKIRQNF